MTFYEVMVRLHVDYCQQVWFAAFEKHRIVNQSVWRIGTTFLETLNGMFYHERPKMIDRPKVEYRRHKAGSLKYTKFRKTCTSQLPFKDSCSQIQETLAEILSR